jgi:flavin reductase (DIM6/NTAB) family NADH-FMN oxidoreductase RutF
MRFSRAGAAALIAVLCCFVASTCLAQASDEGTKKSLGAKTLAAPCPVWVIGSYDASGKPNVMTASWAAICCSQPPCVTVSLRKATQTYGNIMSSKAFTVNIPSEKFVREALYFGSVSGKDVDKFAASGLTPVKSDLVNAPYVKEFPLVIECKLMQTVELGLHTMFIGEIVDVKADETILNTGGAPDLTKLKPLLVAPGNTDVYGLGASLGSMEELGKPLKK